VDQANSLLPDLVTLWIGNNDVLGAATSGVALEGVTLTPAAAFQAKYGAVIDGLSGASRTLVVLNIPDVAAIAFTTTVPTFIVNPANGAQIPLLGPGNAAFPCPSADPCPFPAGTLLTLPAASMIRSGIGVPADAGGTGLALPDGSFTPPASLTAGVILYPDEVAAIQARTDELNEIIAAEASGAGAILVDANAIFDRIRAEGYEIGGLTLTASLLTGGIFSADGIHPSNIAHAIVADEIIQAVNAAEGTDIERPNLSEVLFAADVPAPVPAGGSLGFTSESWRSLLSEFSPVLAGVEVALPSHERPHRATRIIRR
jgi:lysophospholipase L1-like esterase